MRLIYLNFIIQQLPGKYNIQNSFHQCVKIFLFLQYNRFKTPEARNEHVIEVVNLVDSYYKKLGFRVVLSHIEFWKDNKVKFTTNARKVLNY